MEKEFIKVTQESVTLNVTGGRIDSFRELERTTGTVRVYENGCVGVAGCLGEPDEKELIAKAKEALRFGIPYPCRLEGPLVREELREEEIIPIPELIPTMQSFLDRLGELCPRFAFSNKIGLEYNRTEYENSAGRRLVSAGGAAGVALLAQNRGSGNLFDTFFEWSGDHFDADVLLARFQKEYEAFYRPAALAPGRYPVICASSQLLSAFIQHYIGDLYAAGASLLSGKLGQKVFSDRLQRVLCGDLPPHSEQSKVIKKPSGKQKMAPREYERTMAMLAMMNAAIKTIVFRPSTRLNPREKNSSPAISIYMAMLFGCGKKPFSRKTPVRYPYSTRTKFQATMATSP